MAITVIPDLRNLSGYTENERGKVLVRRFFIEGLCGNSPYNNPYDIILQLNNWNTAPNINTFPQIYAEWPQGLSLQIADQMYVNQIDVQMMEESQDKAYATVTYQSNTIDPFGGLNGKVSIGSASYKETIFMDSTGNPLRVFYKPPNWPTNGGSDNGIPAHVNMDRFTSDKILTWDFVTESGNPLENMIGVTGYVLTCNSRPFYGFPAQTLLVREWDAETIDRGFWHNHVVMDFKRGMYINDAWSGWAQLNFYHDDYNLTTPAEITWSGNTITQGNGWTAWLPYQLVDFNNLLGQLIPPWE